MLFTSTLALLSTLAIAAPALEKRADCSTPVRVVSIRGSNEPYHHSSLLQFYSALLEQGAHSQLQGTPYPAQLDWSDPSIYENSVNEGIGSLINIVSQAVKECPAQQIVLVGYSQGAQVLANSLCGNTNAPGGSMIPSWAGDNIKAAVMFGDPTHIASQTFVYGGGDGNGMVPRYDNSDCAPYSSRIASYCHPTDPVCNLGNDGNAHTTYMAENAGEAAGWVMSKLG